MVALTLAFSVSCFVAYFEGAIFRFADRLSPLVCSLSIVLVGIVLIFYRVAALEYDAHYRVDALLGEGIVLICIGLLNIVS
jgi:hypothetical protein